MKSSTKSPFINTEDAWAILIGMVLLIAGLIIFFTAVPENYRSLHAQYNKIMDEESGLAPFRTIDWHIAFEHQQDLRMDRTPAGDYLAKFTGKPHEWSENPVYSFYREESSSGIRQLDGEQVRMEAEKLLVEARHKEAKARMNDFKQVSQNDDAREAIQEWLRSEEKLDNLVRKSRSSGYNQLPFLGGLFVCLALLFGISVHVIDRSFFRFIRGFLFVFGISILAYLLSVQSAMKSIGFGYAAWAILIGLVISNTLGTPGWVKPAVKTELYIKTGLVLLGAEILFGKILAIGIPGIFIAWVVTPVVLVSTYWFGQKILRITSKTLNITISADMSVCGVSAAVAVAAACRAKKEELTLAIGLSMVFTSIMMILMPLFINWVGMPEVLGGAWIGGTIDATGAVVAAGAFLGDAAMTVAATIKMIQNILIGVVAFFVAVYFTMHEEKSAGVSISVMEIWHRFPKFILGFIGASLLFSGLYWLIGNDMGYSVIEQGVIGAWSANLRGWLFCIAFVSIGLATNFRELKTHFRGGKALILYVCGQAFNLLLTLIMAYLMFYVIFPEITGTITD